LLLKNAHTLKGTRRLLGCAANRTAQRISTYASHLNIFEKPQNMDFFSDHSAGNFDLNLHNR